MSDVMFKIFIFISALFSLNAAQAIPLNSALESPCQVVGIIPNHSPTSAIKLLGTLLVNHEVSASKSLLQLKQQQRFDRFINQLTLALEPSNYALLIADIANVFTVHSSHQITIHHQVQSIKWLNNSYLLPPLHSHHFVQA
jgi:hypothetical protein